MIVYKGWGVLGILLPLLGAGLMCGIASLFNPSNAVYLKFALIGVVVGSVGTWFVGQWLNQKRPRVKLARWMEERRKELCSLVDQGQFQLAGPRCSASRQRGGGLRAGGAEGAAGGLGSSPEDDQPTQPLLGSAPLGGDLDRVGSPDLLRCVLLHVVALATCPIDGDRPMSDPGAS